MDAARPSRKAAIAGVVAAVVPTLGLAAEQWTYTAYTPSGRPMPTNAMELTEADGKSFLTIYNYHEYADKCYTRKMNAAVTRDAEFIVITTSNLPRGCAPIRLLLEKDGSGGRQEVLTNGDWVWDNLDHGLVRK